MLKVISEDHTRDNFIHVMKLVVLKEIAFHLKRSTLGRQPFDDQAYPQKLSSTSPEFPLGVMKLRLFLMFVQPHKKPLKK